ncbi:MAG: hypothetical protein ACTTH8_01305 [Treponema sp.]
MKRFLIQVGSMLFLVVLTVLLVNELYKHSYYYKNQAGLNKFSSVPDTIEIANVGSSHGFYNFNYNNYSEYVTFNFGLTGQRHFYNLQLLKTYKHHFKKKAIVLIPISYLEIWTASDVYFDSQLPFYYRIVDWKYLHKHSIRDVLLSYYFPLFVTDKPYKSLLLGLREKDGESEYVTVQYKKASDNIAATKAWAKDDYTSWMKDFNKLDGFSENITALSNLIDFCIENDFIPVLVTTPLSAELNGYFDSDKGFMDTFNLFIANIMSKYPEIQYFNFSHDAAFQNDYSLFFDNNHLNIYGAQLFTDTVITALINNNILTKK